MASLKYKDSNGQFKTIVGYTVKNDVVQTTGSSTTSVMSQSAVTEIIEDITPESLGNGVGTCETSAETIAKEVDIEGYKITQNGFVSITFENDVPSGATLNINNQGAKPIYHKGAPIEDDVISSGDTVMFGYDGSHYVVSSLGGGSINLSETVNISLTQVNGNNADLIGASVTVTNDDTSDTIYSGTWNGSTITTEIDTNTNYTVSVETITGYLACADQSYTAGYQTERYISFQYRAYGAYIEATDGSLYTSEQWSSAGKIVNSIVLITETFKCRIPTTHSEALTGFADANTPGTQYNSRPIYTNSNALTDYNGQANTSALISLDSSANRIQMIAKSYVFPAGQMSYLPACGELREVILNTTIINTCITAVGGNIIRNNPNGRGFFSSTRAENDPSTKDAGEYIRRFYNVNLDGGYSPAWVYYGYQCLPIGSYV